MIHVKKFILNENINPEKYRGYGSELGRDYHKKNDDILGKILSKLGIEVTKDSEIIGRTKFGKFLCNMAVRDGIFMKTGDTFRLNQK